MRRPVTRPSLQESGTVLRLLAHNRSGVQLLADAFAWALGLSFATLVRYDFATERVLVGGLAAVIVVAAVAQAGGGLVSRLYLGRRRFGSFDEVAVLAPTAGGVTVMVLFVDLAAGTPRLVPLSAVLAGGVTAFVLMGAVRYAWRLYIERGLRPCGDALTRLLVFGAGEGGQQLITAMLRNPASPYVPVALIDDDPAKRHLQVRGVPVVGNRQVLHDAARAHGADALLIAIPTAGGELVREVSDLAARVGLDVKVLPPVTELLDGDVDESDIRELTEADLLGRHEIDTDLTSIAHYLAGKRVLVTGAGGSIGSELCRQIHHLAPAELVLLDRDESALHAVQLLLNGRAALDEPDVVIADIRDRERLGEVFADHLPEVVFHAAALKHVTALERSPAEAVKTNVWGTQNLLEMAAVHHVERFVNISTDKAANPVNVLGYTKRISERLTAHTAAEADGIYLSVRFGNVLGSRGSVLTVFRQQVAAGGPLTVTAPDVTRFFMTVEEAVQLVIQAGAIGVDGQALVLDMGAPVRIVDVARRFAAQADRPIDIVYTGLRAGEKSHEELFGDGETDERPVHPLISHVPVPPLSPRAVADIELCAPDRLLRGLRQLSAGGWEPASVAPRG